MCLRVWITSRGTRGMMPTTLMKLYSTGVAVSKESSFMPINLKALRSARIE